MDKVAMDKVAMDAPTTDTLPSIVRVLRVPPDFDYAASLQRAVAADLHHSDDPLHDSEADLFAEHLEDADHGIADGAAPPTSADHGIADGAAPPTSSLDPPVLHKKRKARKASARRKQALARAEANQSAKINQANARRSKRRIKSKTDAGHDASERVRRKYIDEANTVTVEQDALELPSTAGGYSAKNTSQASVGDRPRDKHTKDELVSLHGFRAVDWNGIDPMVIVDSSNRCIAALVGRPPDKSYVDAADAAHSLFLEEHRRSGLPEHVPPHARGSFAAVNAGAMHGKGTLNPINLNLKKNGPLVERLIKNPHVRRLAAFASFSLSAYAPKLYRFARAKLGELYEQSPKLERLFPAHVSIFPTATFNLGPRVWTYKHRDTQNLAYGWCAIQALGNFDYTKGGHLVLWELKLVVEFPAGSLILIPSATITHSNTPVADDETRTSFTQYMPGGLFRWVDFGHSLVGDCKKKNPALYAQQMQAQPLKWQLGLDLLTVVPSKVDQ